MSAERLAEIRFPLEIIEVDYEDAASLLVNFSDGTFTSYSVLELVTLHPARNIAHGENAEVGQ
jgi:hypothetical protein